MSFAEEHWFRPLVAFFCFLFGAAWSVSIESALVGISEPRVQLAVESKVKGAQFLRYWLDAPARLLASLHFIRVVCVVGSGVAAVRFVLYVGWNVGAAPIALVVGAVVLLAGHLFPRAIGKRFAVEWASLSVGFVHWLSLLMVPLITPLTMVVRFLGNLVGLRPGKSGPYWTADEIVEATKAASVNALGSDGDLLHAIIEFSDTVIREIMVPRTEMVALPVSSTIEDVQRAVSEGRHSRVPVYDETMDNVIGLLYVKDLLLAEDKDKNARDNEGRLRALLRPTFYVPEVMKISELMREFQRRKTHLAIVVDEYGGTAGLVTMEDIIEVIVGEIHDEYDVEEKQFKVLSDGKILADGRVSVWDLEEALNVNFPDDTDYETLGGFLVSRTGYLPEAGAVVNWNNLRFTVKEADAKRIGTVEIEKPRAGDVHK